VAVNVFEDAYVIPEIEIGGIESASRAGVSVGPVLDESAFRSASSPC